MMKVNVTLVKGMQFVANSGTGHSVVIDNPDESVGGMDSAPTPMELILLGLAGCTGMDVISILRKKRLNIQGFEVNVEGERAEEHPKVYIKIHVEYVVKGKNIDPAAVERAIELSEEKYCGAAAMLRKTAEITNDYKIIDPEEK